MQLAPLAFSGFVNDIVFGFVQIPEQNDLIYFANIHMHMFQTLETFSNQLVYTLECTSRNRWRNAYIMSQKHNRSVVNAADNMHLEVVLHELRSSLIYIRGRYVGLETPALAK